MYTTKYRPPNLSEFIGNKGVIQPFIRWLLEWDANNKKTKCALVSGAKITKGNFQKKRLELCAKLKEI